MRRTSVLVIALALPVACGTPHKVDANRELAKAKAAPSVNATVRPTPSVQPSSAAPTASASGSTAPSEEPAKPGTVISGPATSFAPAEISVTAGTKVTWENAGGFHTVTGGDAQADPASPIGNGTLAATGDKYEVTFAKAGTYPYFCQPHASVGMKGTVVVT